MASKAKTIERDPNRQHTVILYGDGSAINGQGCYGSGCTGYIFSNEDLNIKSTDTPSKYAITDKGYIETENINKGNYTILVPEYYFDGIFGYNNIGTNNRAELLAYIEPINRLLEDTRLNIEKIIFKTDSEYTIKVIEYTMYMQEREWRVKLNNNQDLVEIIYNLNNRLKANNIALEVIKVLGHSTSLGNNLADRLSNIARITRVQKFHIEVNNKKHWSRRMEIDPLLRFRQMFFISGNTLEPMYGIMDYKMATEPGIKSNDTVFGTIVTKERVEILDQIMSMFSKAMTNVDVMNTIDLNNLYNRDNTYYYSIFGPIIFTFNKRNNTLVGVNNDTIVKQVYPSGLAIQAYENILNIYKILVYYREHEENDYKYVDITDKFYHKDKKNKTVCSLDNTTTSIEFTLDKVDNIGKNINIILSLGKDTLTKNQFKAIEKNNPKVTLVLNKINKTILYKTIVEDDTGNIGIYYNVYTSKLY